MHAVHMLRLGVMPVRRLMPAMPLHQPSGLLF